jgi:hypothetical protein
MMIRIIITHVSNCIKKSVIASLKIQQNAIIAIIPIIISKELQGIFVPELGL